MGKQMGEQMGEQMKNLVNEKDRVNEVLRYSQNDLKKKRQHWIVLLVGATIISFLSGMLVMAFIVQRGIL
jgi:hypothetical protein